MTRKHNMSKGERFESMERRVQSLEMSTRILQMLVRQIGENFSPMASDVGDLAGRQRDIQYRLMAVQELMNLNTDNIIKKAEELQIKDFNEISDKEDAEKGYSTTHTVAEDSIVIFTSKTPNEAQDRGFLRSKLLVSEIAFPDLRAALVGKNVNDTIISNINGTEHVITILGVRSTPPKQKDELKLVESTEE